MHCLVWPVDALCGHTLQLWHHHARCMVCRYGDHAPAEMEAALRGANVVLVIITTDFLRSQYCLEELHWACEEMQRRSSQTQQGQQPAEPFMLVPVFYHDLDPIIGYGVDSLQQNTLTKLLRQHHTAASPAGHAQWINALLSLKERTGIRQDSTARCDQYVHGRA